LKEIHGVSAVSNQPNHISVRQQKQSLKRLKPLAECPITIDLVEGASIGQGTLVFLNTVFENVRGGFSALGQPGKPAERVADEACRELRDFLTSSAAIEPHLADQLILPMALAEGESRLTTSQITRHLTTNIWLVQQLLPVRFDVEGPEGELGTIVKRDA
jgi:RNA 3'-terminal phosphate cyclase (ATP)